MIGEHSWITFLCCQCRCQIFKGERYFRTVFYYNFQTVLVAIVCLKAEISHYGAVSRFYRPYLIGNERVGSNCELVTMMFVPKKLVPKLLDRKCWYQ